MDDKILTKFWEHVQKTDTCWNWTGLVNKGAPILRMGTRPNEKEFYPRRLSLQIAGKQLDRRVLPICKNKLCVNPSHLITGDEERFWSKVCKLSADQGGCWVWTASQDKDMYGKFRLAKDGKKIDIRAHQYSFELANGISVDNLIVCHSCDHPYCVNPAHLFLGTMADNHADRNAKDRQAKGVKQHLAKLTDDDVRLARNLHASGIKPKALAKKFGVGPSTIYDLLSRKTWKHVI